MSYVFDIKALGVRVVMLSSAYMSKCGYIGSYETVYYNMLCVVPPFCSSRHWEKKLSIPAASSNVVIFDTSVRTSATYISVLLTYLNTYIDQA